MSQPIQIGSIDELEAVVNACIASGDKPKLQINPALYNEPGLRPLLDRLVLEHPASQVVSHSREQTYRGVDYLIGATPQGLMPRTTCGRDLIDFEVESVESAIEHAQAAIDDMLGSE